MSVTHSASLRGCTWKQGLGDTCIDPGPPGGSEETVVRGEHGEQPLTPRSKGSADGDHGCHRHLCGPLTLSSAQLPTDSQANLHKFQLELPPPARLCDPEQTNTSSMSRNDSYLRAVWLLQTLSPGPRGSRHGLKTRAPRCIPQEMLAPAPVATGFSLRGPAQALRTCLTLL